jgi:DNA-binding MarR family transcriptional regulator
MFGQLIMQDGVKMRSLSKRILYRLSRYERLETNTELSHALKISPAHVSSVTNRLWKAKKLSRTESLPHLYYVDTRFQIGRDR